MPKHKDDTNHHAKHPNNTSGNNDNAPLHAALLRGTLSIRVIDTDIRRDDGCAPDAVAVAGSGAGASPSSDAASLASTSTGGGGTGVVGGILPGLDGLVSKLLPIETDYILRISPTRPSQKVEETNHNDPHNHRELETFCCSKRYVDLRNLAIELRGHSVAILKYYEAIRKNDNPNIENHGGGSKRPFFKTAGGGNDHNGGSGTSSASSSTKALFKGVFSKPVEYATYLAGYSNTSSSNVAQELDSVFQQQQQQHQHRKKKHNRGGSDGNPHVMEERRTSIMLHQGAPMFVRAVMEGVDEFYEGIFSEKRQFRHKTNYSHVKKVAERRTTIINDAFANFLSSLANAEIHEFTESRRQALVPPPMESLFSSLEHFLLTDVIVERKSSVVENAKSRGGDVAVVTTTTVKAAAQDQNELDSSIVSPLTTRFRASNELREERAHQLRFQSEELVVTEEAGAEERNLMTSHHDSVSASSRVDISTGLLPDDPLPFAIVAAVGAIFFRFVQGQVLTVQLDMLVLFGLSSGLIGYQLALLVMGASIQDSLQHSNNQYASIIDEGSPRKNEISKPQPRPAMKRQSISEVLLKKSVQSLRSTLSRESNFRTASLPKIMPKQIVMVPTLPKFPEGAPIGSHSNCWSSPISKDFHVRGANYLKDKKKVPSDDFLFPCRGCDIFLTDDPPVNIGRNSSILGGKLRDVPTFIINYRLPWGVFVSYHEIPQKFVPYLRRGNGYSDPSSFGILPPLADMAPGERAVCNFLLSDSEERDAVWKMVPVVVEGPWVVKRVVGGKPAIVGTKLPVSYVYQPPEGNLADYLEADLDIVSSAAARNILAVVRSYTQTLTIDLGYVVQGNMVEELPEQMMLGLRIHGLDPLTAEVLPPFEDESMDHPARIEDIDENGYDTD